jgi:hypothetical protein
MAKVYLVTDEEMQSLIESLELERLRKENYLRAFSAEDRPEQTVDSLHRAFHSVAVRWAQAVGANPLRR